MVTAANRTDKRLVKIGDFLLSAGLILWIIETIFFLIKDGWHWKPIDPTEEIWDHIVSFLINGGFFLWAIAIVRHTIREIKEQ